MRLQEHSVFDFDETVFPPPSVGGASPLSCAQAISVALGFALSAGWDWLPSMHILWLRDYIDTVGKSALTENFDMLSGSILFKMAILLALSPVMERLFLAFPPERVAFHQPPFLGRLWCSPTICERLYLSSPLLLAQMCGVFLVFILNFFVPQSHKILLSLTIGAASALFGMVWFVLVTLLPGVWSCIAYGLAIAFSIFISLILDSVPTESLTRIRVLFPLLALPLLPLAVPSAADIRRRIRRHHRQRLFGTRIKGFFLHGLFARRFSILDLFSKRRNTYLVLWVFPLMYGIPLLLDYSLGCPLVCFNHINNPPLERHAVLILSGEISGAFLASSLLAFFPHHSLLVPLLGLSLFGCGSLLTSVFPSPPFNSVAFYIMQLASGCCAAFGLFVLHLFFRRTGFLFRTLARALFWLTFYSSMGGYVLWTRAVSIPNVSLGSHALFMHLLTLGAIIGLFFIYLIRRPLRLLEKMPLTLEDVFTPEVREDPFTLLTPREREVAELVRLGMKNLEISVRLNITETTLRVHLRRIYRKLGIQGRSKLRDFNPLG